MYLHCIATVFLVKRKLTSMMILSLQWGTYSNPSKWFNIFFLLKRAIVYKTLLDNASQTFHIEYKIFLCHLKFRKIALNNCKQESMLHIFYLTWLSAFQYKLICDSSAQNFSSGFCPGLVRNS